jgi:putative ABC transport system ATP-binding protein
LLKSFNQNQGITIIMVTHEPDMASYAGRIVRFLDGLFDTDTSNGKAD